MDIRDLEKRISNEIEYVKLLLNERLDEVNILIKKESNYLQPKTIEQLNLEKKIVSKELIVLQELERRVMGSFKEFKKGRV
jgi:hypothetical protein